MEEITPEMDVLAPNSRKQFFKIIFDSVLLSIFQPILKIRSFGNLIYVWSGMEYIHTPPGQNVAQGAGIEQNSPRPGQEKNFEEIRVDDLDERTRITT